MARKRTERMISLWILVTMSLGAGVLSTTLPGALASARKCCRGQVGGRGPRVRGEERERYSCEALPGRCLLQHRIIPRVLPNRLRASPPFAASLGSNSSQACVNRLRARLATVFISLVRVIQFRVSAQEPRPLSSSSRVCLSCPPKPTPPQTCTIPIA